MLLRYRADELRVYVSVVDSKEIRTICASIYQVWEAYGTMMS